MNEEELKTAIVEQADKIALDCDRAARRDAYMSSRWRTINLTVGLMAVITAAIATAAAGAVEKMPELLKSEPWIGQASSISSALLAAILTFLKPSEVAGNFRQYSFKYHGLRDRLRLFVATGMATKTDNAALLASYEKLLQEKQEIDAEHPIVAEWAYNKAKRRIERKKKGDEGKRRCWLICWKDRRDVAAAQDN